MPITQKLVVIEKKLKPDPKWQSKNTKKYKIVPQLTVKQF